LPRRRSSPKAFNYIELPDRDIASQALLTETALRDCGVRVYSEHCDVRKLGAMQAFVKRTKAELGGLHYLVNNISSTTPASPGTVPSGGFRRKRGGPFWRRT
jgi:NAD(P)-dependent dehydrogenase (short-subunit alcohol dehydrogenase family)